MHSRTRRRILAGLGLALAPLACDSKSLGGPSGPDAFDLHITLHNGAGFAIHMLVAGEPRGRDNQLAHGEELLRTLTATAGQEIHVIVQNADPALGGSNLRAAFAELDHRICTATVQGSVKLRFRGGAIDSDSGEFTCRSPGV